MAWYDGVFESAGTAMKSAGESCLGAGVGVWKECANLVIGYCTADPTSMGAWGFVKSMYNVFLGVGVSLTVLYFAIGWVREEIDIRNNFTLENMFKFFIRLILTSSLLSNGLTLITEIMQLAALLAGQVGASITTNYQTGGIFDQLMEGISGGEYISTGFLCLIGGFIGMAVIGVCGITILLSVLSRFFKLFVCIPFAPVALASFAGGHGLSQSGISWIKTFMGYCLEVVVIALTLVIAFKLFNGNTFFNSSDGWTGTVLAICEICLPMVTAVSCVKGAEGIIRKCLGL